MLTRPAAAPLFEPPRLAVRPEAEGYSSSAPAVDTSAAAPDAEKAGAAAKDGTKDDARKEDERIGPPPPTDALDFFRQSSVLLNPGTLEVEWGLQYSLLESAFIAVLPDASIVPEQLTTRSYLGTLSLRYGLSKRVQPFITLPMGVGHVERAHELGRTADSTYGPGDVLVGTSYLVRDGCDERADLVFNLLATAPTGEPSLATLQPTFAPLGNGFWSVGCSMTATRTFDPVVLFGTVGYAHQFEREFFGVPVHPGEELNYALGAGLAVNDELTFSGQYQSIMQFDSEVADVRIPDSGIEASTMRWAAIVRVTPQKFVEFFIFEGLTRAAPSTTCGLLVTRRY